MAPPGPTARRRARALVGLLAGLALAAGCGEPEPLPVLPTNGVENWFWRDVLAAPLPGEPAPLPEVLEAEPPAARVTAIAAMLERRDPACLTTFLAALKDPLPGVAAAAAEALGELGDPAAIPRLVKGLGPYPIEYEPSIHVRAAEAAALARLGNPAGIPLVLMLLEEDTADEAPRDSLTWEPTQQMVFLRELALPALEALAGTDFDYVPNGSVPDRQAAARRARAWWEQHRLGLWADAPADGPGLTTRLRLMIAHLGAYQLRQIDGARFTLTHVGPAVLPLLQDGLSDADTYVRVHALEVMASLAALSDDKGRARLAIVAANPLLDDMPIVAVTAAAVCAAARIADPLVTALARRGEPEVVLAVVDALGSTRRPVAAQVLEEFAARSAPRTPDLEAALEAARLACDPERDAAAFLAMLASDDADISYPALDRLILLTGSDQGLQPGQAAAERVAALALAEQALARRTGAD